MKRLAVILLYGLGVWLTASFGAEQLAVEQTLTLPRFPVTDSANPAKIMSKPVIPCSARVITVPQSTTLREQRLTYAVIPSSRVQPWSLLRKDLYSRRNDFSRALPRTVKRYVRGAFGTVNVRAVQEFPVVRIANLSTPGAVWLETLSMDDVNRDTLRQDFSREQGLLRRRAGQP